MLYESQLSHTIIAMVEHGVGVALVNPLCAHFARGNVAIRPFEPAIPRRIFLATTKTQSISPLGAAFMAIVQRQLGAVPIP
jgi:DNA-binding transcriptional LysR family regulator